MLTRQRPSARAHFYTMCCCSGRCKSICVKKTARSSCDAGSICHLTGEPPGRATCVPHLRRCSVCLVRGIVGCYDARPPLSALPLQPAHGQLSWDRRSRSQRHQAAPPRVWPKQQPGGERATGISTLSHSDVFLLWGHVSRESPPGVWPCPSNANMVEVLRAARERLPPLSAMAQRRQSPCPFAEPRGLLCTSMFDGGALSLSGRVVEGHRRPPEPV